MYIHKLTNKKDQIIYCESESNYSWIYFNDGSKVLVAKTLKMLEAFLTPSTFIRIHNRYLVNRYCIKVFSKTDCQVKLTNEGVVPVSRRKKSAFKMIFNNIEKQIA